MGLSTPILERPLLRRSQALGSRLWHFTQRQSRSATWLTQAAVRFAAVDILRSLEPEQLARHKAALSALLGDPDADVRVAAGDALSLLQESPRTVDSDRRL